jgi:transposase
MKWYLGIDVSKGYADFVLLSDQFVQIEETFQLDDTRSGHDQLQSWLEALFKCHPTLKIDCAVESTGGFENNWYASLIRLSNTHPLRAARLNPSVVKNASKALLNSNKTDAESAHDIASYLKRYEDQVDFRVQDGRYAAFRSFYNHLEMITKQKTQLINELKQILYTSFPELQRFCKSGVPNWVLTLLIQYPSPAKLAKAKPDKVARIKGITLAKAVQLIEKARQSISSRCTPIDEFLLRQMSENIAQKQLTIKQLKEYLAVHCGGPEKELLETIKGIGSYSASALMIQIEDIARFASTKELASYFGLHPVIRQSGDRKAVSRMSKQGRPAVRGVLYMCANSAVLSDSHFRSIYAKHRARGKNHNQALGVIMHKIIRIAWGVLTRKQPYDTAIDQANQSLNNQLTSSEQNEIIHKRRKQDFDSEAPITRIESKKRRVHALSQVGTAELVRDLAHEPD